MAYVFLIGAIYICWRTVLGVVAWRVTWNRGRYGGFAWGFFPGVVGIIVQAMRPWK